MGAPESDAVKVIQGIYQAGFDNLKRGSSAAEPLLPGAGFGRSGNGRSANPGWAPKGDALEPKARDFRPGGPSTVAHFTGLGPAGALS